MKDILEIVSNRESNSGEDLVKSSNKSKRSRDYEDLGLDICDPKKIEFLQNKAKKQYK